MYVAMYHKFHTRVRKRSGFYTWVGKLKKRALTLSLPTRMYRTGITGTVMLSVWTGYPHEPPLLGVRNPRGLEDSAVTGLLAKMNSR